MCRLPATTSTWSGGSAARSVVAVSGICTGAASAALLVLRSGDDVGDALTAGTDALARFFALPLV